MEFSRKKGFGLISLLISIAIIAALGALFFRNGKFGIIYKQRTAPEDAKNALEEAEQLKQALENKNSLLDMKSNSMNISSPAFENAMPIPAEFTCDGENKNPLLVISDTHPDTKSLVLIMDDPDAPGNTWVHWTVWNISPDTREIAADSVPEGALQGKTSFGKSGYGGPCPHKGRHRYFFKLYALDTVLNIPLTSETADIERAMEGHIIADAKLMGTYSRD